MVQFKLLVEVAVCADSLSTCSSLDHNLKISIVIVFVVLVNVNSNITFDLLSENLVEYTLYQQHDPVDSGGMVWRQKLFLRFLEFSEFINFILV